MQDREDRPDQNEGEGNKSADKAYREGAREFLESHDVDKLSRQAREDLDRDPGMYDEARKESLEHVAEEDPLLYAQGDEEDEEDDEDVIEVELDEGVGEDSDSTAFDDEPELPGKKPQVGGDFKDVRGGMEPPQVRRTEKGPDEGEQREAA